MAHIRKLAAYGLITALMLVNFHLQSFQIIRFYLELRSDGLSHAETMCEVPEFSDNVARALGFSYDESKRIQRIVFDHYCGE